eukprot:CAMPEP_0169236516 /NCGR_PEP_ID=MMETSP1016-20121227/29305_1 /TAXON_ID=342587 /ORGANISM="Karlodinium micrum, Strain CCMP2283" /LENGTH=38 /DNA_ID= /DNA_START= /DNA_END= /DNA_ORIENTATION=
MFAYLVLSIFTAPCFAHEFLKASPKDLHERVSEEDIQT